MTDHAWAPGAKLRFLGLGFLGLGFLGLGFLRLTQTQMPDTEGGSPAGRNLAPRLYFFFILNSAEHEIYPAHKC